MSTCCPETSSTFQNGAFFAASWRTATKLLPRHALGRIWQLPKALMMQQRYRRDLRRLPDYLLRDIGLDVNDARQESRKAFWQV